MDAPVTFRPIRGSLNVLPQERSPDDSAIAMTTGTDDVMNVDMNVDKCECRTQFVHRHDVESVYSPESVLA